MKNILTAILFVFSVSVLGQSTIDPDTVCYQTSGSTYQVPNTVGYVYTWTVFPTGVLVSGQGTNQIVVNWSNSQPGLIPNAISVFATTANGCQSPPIDIDVFILQIIPNITPIGPFCENEGCQALIATPINGIWSGTGVFGNEFCPSIPGDGNYEIEYTVSLAGCQFSSTIDVIVDPIPSISSITHD